MNWQDVIVGVVAIVVVAVIARRVWRFFACRDTSKCSSCSKECSLRKKGH
ncbi:MAG: FeoB-associated Cys-rich membrane protein [Rikenellaceae bacterium]|nr:FeoB-associated Cys-rich membrane protein [Rikenellaceae bacterium]